MISKFDLRRLVESVLLEGFKDDQRWLIEKYPDHARDLDHLPPKWIAWLTSRFGKSPTEEETHPFDDSITTIKKFFEKDSAIGQKYANSAQFKEAIDQRFPPDSRAWRVPNDPMTMSVDDMELIIRLFEMKKQRFKVDDKNNIESDRIGKVGLWNLWLPTTRENSCSIAQYDPDTREPKTTWCTARTAGSNLFYNYIGRPGENITLFYVIKDDPKEDEDWLSIGFINGKPELKGQNGGLSVDRANKGLNVKRLSGILGSHYDEIMRILKEKNISLGGMHPAQKKVQDAARSVETLRYLVTGLGAEEATDLKELILKEREIDPDVLMVLANDKSEKVRAQVVYRDNLSLDLLSKFAEDESEDVRKVLPGLHNLPSGIMAKLAKDHSDKVRSQVIMHATLTPAMIEHFANDESEKVRSSLAYRDDAPIEILAKLADDENEYVRHAVAKRRDAPVELLAKLADDEHEMVRRVVASRSDTPIEILAKLADDENKNVAVSVSYNKRTPAKILRKIADRADKELARSVLWHKNVPVDVLVKFANDEDHDARSGIARNLKTPPEILAKLAQDSDDLVRASVAANRRTPSEVLGTLAREPIKRISFAAAANPSTPPDALMHLVGSPDHAVIFGLLANNPGTPTAALTILADSPDSVIRASVAKHKNTSVETLRKLAADIRSPRTREEAAKNLQGRQQALNEHRLRQLIRRML